jgi:hypothetical protein
VAARVDGTRITRAQIQQYVDYTLRYYSWADTSRSTAHPAQCFVAHRANQQCTVLQAEALRRLIEERLILMFANTHGIQIAANERARLSSESRHLLAQRPTAGRSLQQSGVTFRFLRSVLKTQMLVEEVEQHVTSSPISGGQVLHIQTVTLKPVQGESPVSRYHAAEGIVAGDPVPAGATIKTAWFTKSQLLPGIRGAVLSASDGQTIGPYPVGSSFLVIRILGRGDSVPGDPANALTGFHIWLQQLIKHRHVTCFDTQGRHLACPALHA